MDNNWILKELGESLSHSWKTSPEVTILSILFLSSLVIGFVTYLIFVLYSSLKSALKEVRNRIENFFETEGEPKDEPDEWELRRQADIARRVAEQRYEEELRMRAIDYLSINHPTTDPSRFREEAIQATINRIRKHDQY